MKTTITVKFCSYMGRRVNRTPESDIPEEVKIAEAEAKKAKRTRRNSRVLAVWGTILAGLPFVLPVVFFINGALTGHPLPIMMYPYLVLAFHVFSNVGGLILYLASRNANYLRKPIGWSALATALLPMLAALLYQDHLLRFDAANLTRPLSVFVFVLLLLTLLCMLALCVFAVLMLIRVYPKQKNPEPEA